MWNLSDNSGFKNCINGVRVPGSGVRSVMSYTESTT